MAVIPKARTRRSWRMRLRGLPISHVSHISCARRSGKRRQLLKPCQRPIFRVDYCFRSIFFEPHAYLSVAALLGERRHLLVRDPIGTPLQPVAERATLLHTTSAHERSIGHTLSSHCQTWAMMREADIQSKTHTPFSPQALHVIISVCASRVYRRNDPEGG